MATTANRGLVGLFKKYWHEVPELVAGGMFGIIGMGILVTTGYMYYANDGDNRRYRGRYVVLRHDDPAVQRLKISCNVTSKPYGQ